MLHEEDAAKQSRMLAARVISEAIESALKIADRHRRRSRTYSVEENVYPLLIDEPSIISHQRIPLSSSSDAVGGAGRTLMLPFPTDTGVIQFRGKYLLSGTLPALSADALWTPEGLAKGESASDEIRHAHSSNRKSVQLSAATDHPSSSGKDTAQAATTHTVSKRSVMFDDGHDASPPDGGHNPRPPSLHSPTPSCTSAKRHSQFQAALDAVCQATPSNCSPTNHTKSAQSLFVSPFINTHNPNSPTSFNEDVSAAISISLLAALEANSSATETVRGEDTRGRIQLTLPVRQVIVDGSDRVLSSTATTLSCVASPVAAAHGLPPSMQLVLSQLERLLQISDGAQQQRRFPSRVQLVAAVKEVQPASPPTKHPTSHGSGSGSSVHTHFSGVLQMCVVAVHGAENADFVDCAASDSACRAVEGLFDRAARDVGEDVVHAALCDLEGAGWVPSTSLSAHTHQIVRAAAGNDSRSLNQTSRTLNGGMSRASSQGASTPAHAPPKRGSSPRRGEVSLATLRAATKESRSAADDQSRGLGGNHVSSFRTTIAYGVKSRVIQDDDGGFRFETYLDLVVAEPWEALVSPPVFIEHLTRVRVSDTSSPPPTTGGVATKKCPVGENGMLVKSPMSDSFKFGGDSCSRTSSIYNHRSRDGLNVVFEHTTRTKWGTVDSIGSGAGVSREGSPITSPTKSKPAQPTKSTGRGDAAAAAAPSSPLYVSPLAEFHPPTSLIARLKDNQGISLADSIQRRHMFMTLELAPLVAFLEEMFVGPARATPSAHTLAESAGSGDDVDATELEKVSAFLKGSLSSLAGGGGMYWGSQKPSTRQHDDGEPSALEADMTVVDSKVLPLPGYSHIQLQMLMLVTWTITAKAPLSLANGGTAIVHSKQVISRVAKAEAQRMLAREEERKRVEMGLSTFSGVGAASSSPTMSKELMRRRREEKEADFQARRSTIEDQLFGFKQHLDALSLSAFLVYCLTGKLVGRRDGDVGDVGSTGLMDRCAQVGSLYTSETSVEKLLANPRTRSSNGEHGDSLKGLLASFKSFFEEGRAKAATFQNQCPDDLCKGLLVRAVMLLHFANAQLGRWGSVNQDTESRRSLAASALQLLSKLLDCVNRGLFDQYDTSATQASVYVFTLLKPSLSYDESPVEEHPVPADGGHSAVRLLDAAHVPIPLPRTVHTASGVVALLQAIPCSLDANYSSTLERLVMVDRNATTAASQPPHAPLQRESADFAGGRGGIPDIFQPSLVPAPSHSMKKPPSSSSFVLSTSFVEITRTALQQHGDEHMAFLEKARVGALSRQLATNPSIGSKKEGGANYYISSKASSNSASSVAKKDSTPLSVAVSRPSAIRAVSTARALSYTPNIYVSGSAGGGSLLPSDIGSPHGERGAPHFPVVSYHPSSYNVVSGSFSSSGDALYVLVEPFASPYLVRFTQRLSHTHNAGPLKQRNAHESCWLAFEIKINASASTLAAPVRRTGLHAPSKFLGYVHPPHTCNNVQAYAASETDYPQLYHRAFLESLVAEEASTTTPISVHAVSSDSVVVAPGYPPHESATSAHTTAKVARSYLVPPTHPALLLCSRTPQQLLRPLSFVLLTPGPAKAARLADRCATLLRDNPTLSGKDGDQSAAALVNELLQSSRSGFSSAVAAQVDACISNDDEDHINMRRRQKQSLMWASRKEKEEASVELSAEKHFNHHLLSVSCLALPAGYALASGDDDGLQIQADAIPETTPSTMQHVTPQGAAHMQEDADGGYDVARIPNCQPEQLPGDDDGVSDEQIPSTPANAEPSPTPNRIPAISHAPSKHDDGSSGVQIPDDDDSRYLLHLAHMRDKKKLLETIVQDYLFALSEEDRLEGKRRELVEEVRALVVANPHSDEAPNPRVNVDGNLEVGDELDSGIDFYVHTGECKPTAVAAIAAHKRISIQLKHLHLFAEKLLYYMRLLCRRVVGEAGQGGPLTSVAAYAEQERADRSAQSPRQLSPRTQTSAAPRTPLSVARHLGGRPPRGRVAPSPRRESAVSDVGSIVYAADLSKEQFTRRYIQRRQRTLNLVFDDEPAVEEDPSLGDVPSGRCFAEDAERGSPAPSAGLVLQPMPIVRRGNFHDDRPGSAQHSARRDVLLRQARFDDPQLSFSMSRPLSSSFATPTSKGRAGRPLSAASSTGGIPRSSLAPSLSASRKVHHLSSASRPTSAASSQVPNLTPIVAPSVTGGIVLVRTYSVSDMANSGPLSHRGGLDSMSLTQQSLTVTGPKSSSRGATPPTARHDPYEHVTPPTAADSPGAVDLWYGRRQLMLKRANELLSVKRRQLAQDAIHNVLGFLSTTEKEAADDDDAMTMPSRNYH